MHAPTLPTTAARRPWWALVGRSLRAARAGGRALVLAQVCASVGCTAVLARLGVPPAQRARARAGERIARRLDRLGGAYLKVGQILSTRVDLLPDAQRAPFARLCDQATRRRADVAAASVAAVDGLTDVDPVPFAAGSFTHVHRACRCDSGAQVVVKVLRPDAHARYGADLALIRGFARIGARVPLFASVPVIEAIALLGDAVSGHLDLAAEGALQQRLSEDLAGRSDVVVPRPHLDLSTPSMLVMDPVAGARRIDDPRLGPELQRVAALAALRALYTMLFAGGLVHCDLHPGNMLVTPDGRLVILDVGYAAQLDDDQQTAFARLFKSMALADAQAVADVVIETATRLPPDLDRDRLVRDLGVVVARASGRTTAQFNVTGFVTNLFAVQRRHAIVASPGFTMGIVALITLEGVLKELTPDLDFQREALPFVLDRLEHARRRQRRRATAPAAGAGGAARM
ncbi:MAG TPA: AarF/UbiB family protein [Solirubrobacteraceae bacterium]|jgi:ubiquinone biosynthesis protein|nr:AarF/UbiB family protein [Solirubrobacteraceae bacterium]